jgi:threonine dehydratase
MVGIDDIRRAAERLGGVAHRTPLSRSETLSARCRRDVYLKFENRQKTGSFKIRGAYNKLAQLSPAERDRGVVAASAGNHAQGVARAAAMLGIPAVMYMPIDASLAKIGATREYGAEVRLAGVAIEETLEAAREAEARERLTFVHPFDDEQVIAGQGTIGLEIVEDVPDVDSVVVPVGGGGLVSGAATAIKAVRDRGVRVVGVAVAGYAPYARDPAPAAADTVADGIAVTRPGRITAPLVERLVDDMVTVSDAQISQAIVQLLEREKTVVEGAGAAAVAAVLAGMVEGSRTVVVLSGGNIDSPRLIQVIRFGLTDAGRYLVVRTVLVDRPGALMRLLRVIADAHVNVLSVSHHREGIAMAAAETGIEITMETRGEEHAEEIVALLRAHGYAITRLG